MSKTYFAVGAELLEVKARRLLRKPSRRTAFASKSEALRAHHCLAVTKNGFCE
ncbi:hypothetical protein MHZ92_04275 [Sporosarcina sp. ACRSL]|uniref:hypothetical protein n=1 Tax=Sporosarcina sp. ACRSL TaxID=2918215 RepID=UPI001EF5E606|nr:hypothetical protein [Sporosarcina sp. ACRSL]MCG7343334.1 hypothetical protein [Sporosarcina sp. ACRSL]